MRGTNSGAYFCGAHFRMHQAWLFTARYRNFGTHAKEDLAGRFESRPGGGKRSLEFRTAWQSVIRFRGRVINAGFACLRVANVALFSTRRERALCDSAGAVSTRFTRALANGCLGTARQLACRFVVGPGRAVSFRPGRSSGAGVEQSFACLRVGCSIEAAFGLAFDHRPQPLVPAQSSFLSFCQPTLNSRLSADSVQL